MRRSASLSAALFAFALLAEPAAAEPPEAALDLYASGRYVAAAEIADRDLGSADSLAFAARSRLAACLTRGEGVDIDALLDRAEADARAALALQPNSVEARLRWALTLGVRGRRASLPEALARRYAPRGRHLIDEALAIAPDNAEANALLGAWHLEILRRGGRAGALVMGARLSDGIAAFDRARALAPHDPMIALQYAVALTELDAPRFSNQIAALLGVPMASPPRDAFEAHGREIATQLSSALHADGPRAAAQVLRQLVL